MWRLSPVNDFLKQVSNRTTDGQTPRIKYIHHKQDHDYTKDIDYEYIDIQVYFYDKENSICGGIGYDLTYPTDNEWYIINNLHTPRILTWLHQYFNNQN